MEAYISTIDALLSLLSSEMNIEKESLWCQVSEDLPPSSSKHQIKDYIENVIKEGRLGFNHVSFDDLIKKEQEQDDYIRNPIEAEEGVVQCKKCGSYKVYSISIQTRAADEATTTMSQCTVCKNRWSYNG